MNKNTVFAFVLILATVAFFSSPTWNRFYDNKILHQPYPAYDAKAQKPTDNNGGEQSLAPAPSDTQQTRSGAGLAAASAVPGTDSTAKKGDTVWVETDKLIAGISEEGAKLVSLKMKDFRLDHLKGKLAVKDSSGYVDLLPANSAGGAGMTINNTAFDKLPFSVQNDAAGKRITVTDGENKAITFVCHDPQGNVVQKQFLFDGDSYKIGLRISSSNLTNSRLTVSWLGGITESENNKGGFLKSEERKAHYFDGQSVQHFRATKTSQEDVSGFYRWIGVSSKYFFVGLVADTTNDADLKINAIEVPAKDQETGKKNKIKAVNYSFSYQYSPQSNSADFWFYAGPSKFEVLKSFHLQFQKILFPVLGWTKVFFFADKWFPPVAEFILWLLLAFYHFTRDYGVSIILLTILSRVITYPLTQSSMKSMNRMKDVQPKINAIRQKYKNNPQKMNAEIMALYKTEGINPLNPGCLPMFLQMPVFIALFVVLQKAIELRGAGTVLVPWIHDLSRPESVFSLTSILPDGIPMYGSNFAILPIVMAILTYFQNKATIKDPNQKMMIYFMPIFMLVLFNNFPSGLVLYWTVSSLIQLVQQLLTDKYKQKAAVVVEKNVQTRGVRAR